MKPIAITPREHLQLELHAVRVKINKLEAWCYINAYTPLKGQQRAEIKKLLEDTYIEQRRLLKLLLIIKKTINNEYNQFK